MIRYRARITHDYINKSIGIIYNTMCYNIHKKWNAINSISIAKALHKPLQYALVNIESTQLSLCQSVFFLLWNIIETFIKRYWWQIPIPILFTPVLFIGTSFFFRALSKSYFYHCHVHFNFDSSFRIYNQTDACVWLKRSKICQRHLTYFGIHQ